MFSFISITTSIANFFSADVWYKFIVSLFGRQEFLSNLIQNNFFKSRSITEMIIAVLLWVSIAYVVAIYIKKHPHKSGFIAYLRSRLILPTILLIVGIIAAFIWTEVTGQSSLWLRLVAITAPWMMLIRTVTAVLYHILPHNKLSSSTSHFLSAVIWLGYVLWLSGLDDILKKWANSIVIPLGGKNISFYVFANGIFWIIASLIIALWIAKIIENHIQKLEHLDINLRIVLVKIIKSAMAILAVIITLPMIGIDLTVLSVFGGALGIGLGFGLQKIASNYVSGFIILLDRSIRPGDRLTISDFTGVVSKITSRFVVLRSTTGTEALIPNESFIANTVVNASYSSKKIWRKLDIQVSYQSDLSVAMEILKNAAAKHSRIEKADAFVTSFGSDGINLALGFWLLDPENSCIKLDSDILFEIWEQFKANNIEIPYPQREVRILNDSHAIVNIPVASDDYSDDTTPDLQEKETV